MSEPIVCAVSEIRDSDELIINAGSVDGVEVGMSFGVKAVIDLVDPNDSSRSERVEVDKVVVRVAQVWKKFTLCLSEESTVASLGLESRQRFEYAGEAKGSVYDHVVEVGDRVVQVLYG